MTREDVIEIVEEAMKHVVAAISPEVVPVEEPAPQTVQLPIETVQFAGEKVNYRIALNPEIFFRYSVFKARAASLGRKRARARFSSRAKSFYHLILLKQSISKAK
jgi:hypothetical protein